VTIQCPKSINAVALRATRTSEVGVPVAASVANSRVTTAGFISATMAPNVEAGEETTVKKANGQICLSRKLGDQLKWLDVTVELCGVPYPILSLLLGVTGLTSGADIVGGVLASQSAAANVQPAQLEFWSLNADTSSAFPYVQWVLPLTKNWQISGDLALSTDALNFTIQGQAYQTSSYQPAKGTEWTGGQISAIQAGGPLAWKATNSLPPVIDDCAFNAVGS
jgi:hypothetical protein